MRIRDTDLGDLCGCITGCYCLNGSFQMLIHARQDGSTIPFLVFPIEGSGHAFHIH
jgi:hypothetical protein